MTRVQSTLTLALTALIISSAVACGGKPTGQAAAPATPGSSSPGGEGTLPPGHPPTGGPGLVRSQGSTAGGAGAPASAPQWDVPEAWQVETPSSSMRQAQYRLPATAGGDDGECAVFYFGPGQGGDVQGNIMRWAGQFSTEDGGTPSPEVSTLEAGGQTVTRVEVGGAYVPSPMSMSGAQGGGPQPGYRLFGAIVPGPDAHWFIKCTGPDKTMEANRAAFDGMLSSVHYGS